MTTKVKAHVHYDIELTDLEFEPDVADLILESEVQIVETEGEDQYVLALQGGQEIETQYRLLAEGTDYDILERYFMDEWHTEVIAKVIARHNYGISVGTLWFGEETQTGGYNVVVARRLNGKPEIRRYGSVAYRVKNTLTCFGEGCQR